ncbi:Versicolorin B desaturase, partial [Colletotrichum tanaceti]
MNSSGTTTFDSTNLSPTTWVSRPGWTGWYVVVALVVAYGASLVVYNLYFHPLAEYPGPWLGRASLLWRFIHTTTGHIHLDLEKLHRKYGPVVRVSPNELSFGSTESWKAVYGHSNAERPTPTKGPFYEIFAAGFRSLCVGSERDPKRHGEMRKMLSSAFSQRSLLDQEHIVSRKIDDFVAIIGRKGGPGSGGINM